MQVFDLKESVQRNCDVADARYGAEFTLCTYLMKMREYYRWEQGLPFSAHLPKQAVGDWLSAREQRWDDLAEAEYAELDIAGVRYDPFDAEGINRALAPMGLVYSGGLGRGGKAHFFLAELERSQELDGFAVYVAGRELARDLAAPPAMMREDRVFVRRESLRRWLWEKLESWRWSRPDNALGRAFACYDFEGQLEPSLERMTDTELEMVLLHEIGEFYAGVALGDGWNRMLLAFAHTPLELMLRAVRDHLADCLSTLPGLLERERPESLHFYVGNLSHMRRELFPSLEAAYRAWLESRDPEPLRDLARRGREHWEGLAGQLLALWERRGTDALGPAQGLVRSRYL
jgi:hypothetical protein